MSHIWNDYGPTQPPGTDDLSPLDDNLRAGLAVIGALAVVSLILCTSLFSFITYRVIQGRLSAPSRPRCSRSRLFTRRPVPPEPRSQQQQLCRHTSNNTINAAAKSPLSPLSPASDPWQRGQLLDTADEAAVGTVPNIRRRYQGYNPLLVLIYMLLIADIIQSTSFIPNLVWVNHDAITVRSESCWAQGWLRSQGDVASAIFAAAVSINTYLLVVHRYTMPSKALRLIVASVWSFSFIIVAAGVWASNNGRGHGGYFVRVDTWCWISQEYAGYRLWTHFSWVLAMLSIIVLACIGTAIKIRVPDPNGPRRGLLRVVGGVRIQLRNPRKTGHHPAFLIYPLVYFVCCAPMAIGPMILASGVTVKQGYFLWAGAMIASNGWLDVLLWSLTMIFLAPKDIKEAGLSGFAFLRTPSVEYGNMVWVEAGQGGGGNETRSKGGVLAAECLQPLARMLRRDSGKDRRQGCGWESLSTTNTDKKKQDGITYKTVTSVVVESSLKGAVDGIGHSPAQQDEIAPRPSFVYAREDIVTVPRRVAHRF
ncbi:hypothetical protein N8I77_009571 [Diaporthe amygdali]|uniref:Glucose receptor Git3 N-terminal domain-containing protein n=1 Tax=Phomopsis amygdali TaxID=1214568 RepID=A0AAD9SA34_PHOAM|nr:hypothetical protein N8I77_009571 [Diaporthe amygdali]